MENQLTTFVCPNCGANTTNTHHCDYCGSILVRFAANNVAIDETKYGKKANTIPGLKEELKTNLFLQKTLGEKYQVCTQFLSSDTENHYMVTIGNRNTFDENQTWATWAILFEDGGFINLTRCLNFPESAPIGLIIVFSFYHLKTDMSYNVKDELINMGYPEEYVPSLIRSIIKHEATEEKFLSSSYSHLAEKRLFQPVQGGDNDEDGSKWSKIGYVNHYIIDFGEDYESAANVITQIFYETEGLSPDKVLDTYYMETKTTPCGIELKQAQKRAELEAKEKAKAEELERAAEEHFKKEDKKIYFKCFLIGIIFLIIVFVLYFYNN